MVFYAQMSVVLPFYPLICLDISVKAEDDMNVGLNPQRGQEQNTQRARCPTYDYFVRS